MLVPSQQASQPRAAQCLVFASQFIHPGLRQPNLGHGEQRKHPSDHDRPSDRRCLNDGATREGRILEASDLLCFIRSRRILHDACNRGRHDARRNSKLDVGPNRTKRSAGPSPYVFGWKDPQRSRSLMTATFYSLCFLGPKMAERNNHG
jgi:hypothetical protein